MNFTQLSKNISLVNQRKEVFTQSFWPKDIVFDSKIVKRFKKLSEFSNKKSSTKRTEGSSGYEYALSTFFFIDSIYTTPVVTGDYSSVSTRHSVQFKENYSENNQKVVIEIELDGSKYKTKTYQTEYIQKNLVYGFTGTFHTHPKTFFTQNGQTTSYFSFFSSQDILTLVQGQIPVIGLILDDEMWLACKTQNSQMIPQELLSQTSETKIKFGNEPMVDFIEKNLMQFGIEFYFGKLGGRLFKL